MFGGEVWSWGRKSSGSGTRYVVLLALLFDGCIGSCRGAYVSILSSELLRPKTQLRTVARCVLHFLLVIPFLTDSPSLLVFKILHSSCPIISGISVVPPPPALARPKAQGVEETYCSPSWEGRFKACRRVALTLVLKSNHES